MITAVLFDVGGVLYADPGKQMHADIIRTLGVSEEAWNEVWGEVYEPFSKGTLSEEELWMIVKEKLALTAEIPQNLFLNAHSNYFQPNKPMLDAVEIVRKKGVQVGILSNIYKPQADYNKKHHVYDGFSPVLLSCEVGMKKPEPKIFALALSQLRLPANHVLFIDDKESNVEVAKKAGLIATTYNETITPEALFAPFGVTVSA